MDDKETCITRIQGDDHVGIYTGERKYINHIYRLKEKYPDEVNISHVNQDGSINAEVPYKWMRMPSPPRKVNMTDERKAELRERLLGIREQGKI